MSLMQLKLYHYYPLHYENSIFEAEQKRKKMNRKTWYCHGNGLDLPWRIVSLKNSNSRIFFP